MISAAIVAASWTVQALRDVRRQLKVGGIRDARVLAAPDQRGWQVVQVVLRFGRATCLERSLLRQEWLRAQGHYADVIVGVTAPDDFGAHAWLDGEERDSALEFVEIHRIHVRT